MSLKSGIFWSRDIFQEGFKKVVGEARTQPKEGFANLYYFHLDLLISHFIYSRFHFGFCFVFFFSFMSAYNLFFFIQYTWYSNYLAYNLQWGFLVLVLFFLRLCTLFELPTN